MNRDLLVSRSVGVSVALLALALLLSTDIVAGRASRRARVLVFVGTMLSTALLLTLMIARFLEYT